jgi:hypothetical protein
MRNSALALCAIAFLLAGCKKSEDAPQANAPPSSVPAHESTVDPATPAQPGYGQAPAPTTGGLPSATTTPSEDEPTLEKPVEYQTIEEAETALSGAKTELDKLLTKPGGGADRLATDDARCENACKAFASMKRAADAVCRLAGDPDARCKKARTLVKSSEARVAVCKCEG